MTFVGSGDGLAAIAACLSVVSIILLMLLLARSRSPVAGDRLARLGTELAREGAELRVAVETRLAELGRGNAEQIASLGEALTQRLHVSVEGQMQSSFARVTEQFAAVQKVMGDVQATASGLADLRRLFGNVRARGAWGEGQLRALLDDVLPAGAYEANCRLRDDSTDVVEFAIRMPVATGSRLLAIDAKFPTAAYDRLLAADEAGDAEAARAARRALEAAVRLEARRISGKYIVPPATVEYAVLYLPTDGLYVEVSRLPGLLDEIGRVQRVVVMGPAILPGLLRSIHLGYVTLALGERTEAIGRLLDGTRSEMVRLDAALEKLSRHAHQMTGAIDEARRRTRVLGRKLGEVADEEAETGRALPRASDLGDPPPGASSA